MQTLRKLTGLMVPLVCMAMSVPALAEPLGAAPKTTASWLSVLIAVVLAIAVGVGSFINPKRGHRD